MENFNWPMLAGSFGALAVSVIAVKVYLNNKAFEKMKAEEELARKKEDEQISRQAFRDSLKREKAKAPEKIEAPVKSRGKKAQRFTGKRKVRVTGAHGSAFRFVDWDEYCSLFELGVLLFDMYDDGIYVDYIEDVLVTYDDIDTSSQSVTVNDAVHIASPAYEPPVESSPIAVVETVRDTSYSSSSYSSSYDSGSSSSYDSGSSSCDCGGCD